MSGLPAGLGSVEGVPTGKAYVAKTAALLEVPASLADKGRLVLALAASAVLPPCALPTGCMGSLMVAALRFLLHAYPGPCATT